MEGCRNFPSITAAFDGQKSTQRIHALCAFSLLEIFSFDQASHIIFEVSAGDLDEIHQPADSKKAKSKNIQNSCAHLADIKPMDSKGTNEDTQKQRHNLVFVADSIIPGIVLVHIRRGRLVGIGRLVRIIVLGTVRRRCLLGGSRCAAFRAEIPFKLISTFLTGHKMNTLLLSSGSPRKGKLIFFLYMYMVSSKKQKCKKISLNKTKISEEIQKNLRKKGAERASL